MFPKIFETTVYVEQRTICPLDLFKPPQVASAYRWQPLPEYRHMPVPVPTTDSNRNFEFTPPHNPPVQEATPHAIDLDSVRRDVSNRKADLPQCENKSILGKRPGLSEAQNEQVKRRRKKEAQIFCQFPGCGGNFTTDLRLETHIKGCHLGIKDNICVWPGCSYATAYATDLNRHCNSKVHEKLEEKKRKERGSSSIRKV